MRIDRRRGRLAIVLPAIAGLGLLAGGLLLLPNAREIRHAERRNIGAEPRRALTRI